MEISARFTRIFQVVHLGLVLGREPYILYIVAHDLYRKSV